MADDGPAARTARGLGPRLEGLALVSWSRPARRFVSADIEGAGAIQQIWITPANARWRDLILRIYWDGQDQPSVECPARGFLRLRLGPLRPGEFARRLRQSGRRSTATGRCRSAAGARITLENRDPDEEASHLLPDQLRPDRGSGGCGLFSRPVPPHQPAAVQGGLYRARRRQRARTLRRDLCRLGRQQFRLVGRGRDQVLSRRRRQLPTICGTGTEDYFCGAYNFDAGRSIPPSREPISNSRRPIPGCRRSSGRTGPTSRSSASASTAGTSWTRSASRRTSR